MPPGVAVGGVVGGVIVVLLVGVAVTALIVTLVVVRHRLKEPRRKQDQNVAAMENAGYEGGMLKIE
jgi:Ca2+/Na+ antiporter